MTFFDLFCALTIFLCILISAFLSASETSFIAASRVRIHHHVKQGSKRARVVKTMQGDMSGFLSFLLLTNTLVNILSGSAATYLFTRFYGEVGVFYATLMMTFLLVLFCEVIPKICALSYPEIIALNGATALKGLQFFISPFSKFLEKIARFLLNLVGFKSQTHEGSAPTTEELRSFLELYKSSHQSFAHEREMLQSILDLAKVDVEEIMVHRKNVVMMNADANPGVLLEQALKSPYTRFPLWKDQQENIVGLLHTKAFFREIASHPVDTDSIDILSISHKPWFIPSSTKLLDQLHAFRQRKEHSALVVDEYGAFMGLVTLEDILEEIVGEIADELDDGLPNVSKTPEGEYLIEGTATLRDLNRQFNWNLPDGKASTLAGLVLHESRQIPKIGQTFFLYGLEITILRRSRNQIVLLKVLPRVYH